MPFQMMEQRDAGKTSGLFKDKHTLSEGKTDCRKLKTLSEKHVISSREDVQLHQSTVSYDVESPVEKENEAQSIRNLLPDEDDLFSGIIDKLGCGTRLNGREDEEDLFQSGGGMELEADTNGFLNGQITSNGSIATKHSYDEKFSRTLLVTNISTSIEDSELRSLFEKYGDIHSLYTNCKHLGHIIVSFYDIRAAWSARNSLSNKPSRARNLDTHYLIAKDPLGKDIQEGTLVVSNIDSSLSNDNIRQIFGSFGEIKEIGEAHQCNKFIEYYDIRSAEAAYRTLNCSNIAGKQIKLELGPDRQYVMQQFLPLLTLYKRSHRESLDGKSSLEQLAFTGTVSPSSMTPSYIYGSFSVPGSFPVRLASGHDRFLLHEPRHSSDHENFGSSCPPNNHLRSLPEYYSGSPPVFSYNTFSTVADLSIDASPRRLEGVNGRNIYLIDPKGQQAKHHVGVFGSSRTTGCTIPEGHYVQNNSNMFQRFSSSPLGWPQSLPLASGIHAHGTPNPPELSRSSSHGLNTVSYSHDMINKVSYTQSCRDGAAQASNQSQWNSEHTYIESIEKLGFHNKASDFAPRNYLHDGNQISKYFNSAVSPTQRSSDFASGVNLVTPAPTSCSAPKERMRNLSNCRNEADSSHSDRMQYELDIDRVLRGEETRTTLMIKNIPNKYTSKLLMATIDEQHRGTYDFIYLPIDFKNKCNMGYAFINMIDTHQIIPFYKTFNGKKWEKFNSGKVALITYARIQGRSALVAHFQNSSLMNEDKRCRPILFCTEGPNAGEQEPFPLGTSIRSRSSKPRSSFNEEKHNQAITSGEASSSSVHNQASTSTEASSS
ncbi:Meiosis protein mei2 [Heracleum sosnowskyi]|uniref:Meiosis protein mei2 n=1 Tax=Heracleum sosnowskyi TaxID=360622 RepID=A0AAD8H4K8_9APIA|nr:Meiosis protein mei2 [Heracleum sosnowskyi]